MIQQLLENQSRSQRNSKHCWITIRLEKEKKIISVRTIKSRMWRKKKKNPHLSSSSVSLQALYLSPSRWLRDTLKDRIWIHWTASERLTVHSSLCAHPQTLVANAVSAAQRSVCTLQKISGLHISDHCLSSVIFCCVCDTQSAWVMRWTWSSWPSLGAKLSLFLRPSRDPVGAVLTTCLKTQWLEG